MNQQPAEEIYEVCWRGPFSPEAIATLTSEQLEKFVLYSVYGAHPTYGNNVLLYIGMTERGVIRRLAEHGYEMDLERFNDSQVYLASIGQFLSWDDSSEKEIFERPDRHLVERIESLLIYAHQPYGNSRNKHSANRAAGLRIFNTERHASLHPEVSALYENIMHSPD